MIYRFGKTLAGALTLLILILVSADIVTRVFVGRSLIWVEETSRILFVWAVLLGSAASVASDEHIRIDMVYSLFPKRIRSLLDIVGYIIIILTLGYVLYSGYRLVIRYGSQPFPISGLARGWMYAATCLGSLMMLIGLIENYLQRLKQKHDAGRNV